jgi:hypothetical protein
VKEQFERMLRWHAKLSAFRTPIDLPPIKISREAVEAVDKEAREWPADPDGYKRLVSKLPTHIAQEIAAAFKVAIRFDDLQDHVQIFFQQCFHLKDWIKNDATASGAVGDVEAFVASTPVLECARAICNGSKHLALRAPNIAPKIQAARIYAGADNRITPQPIVEIAGAEHDVFQLADKCVDAWRTYLSKHGLV